MLAGKTMLACKGVIGCTYISLPRACRQMKDMKSNPNPIKQPNTFGSDQGREIPPHCRARFKHDVAPSSKTAPGMSSWRSLCVHGSPPWTAGGGVLRENQIRVSPTAPNAGGIPLDADDCWSRWRTEPLTKVEPEYEAPSERLAVSDSSTNQRSYGRPNTIQTKDDGQQLRLLPQGNTIRRDRGRPAHQTGSAQPGNSSSDNESHRIRRDSRDDRADLEDDE